MLVWYAARNCLIEACGGDEVDPAQLFADEKLVDRLICRLTQAVDDELDMLRGEDRYYILEYTTLI